MKNYIKANKMILFLVILTSISNYISAKEFSYDSQGKKDPFFKISQEKETKEIEYAVEILSPKEKLHKLGIKPSSIIYDEVNPAILIGDEILEVGNTIKGVIIRAIERDYVIFEVEGETVEYNLNNLNNQ